MTGFEIKDFLGLLKKAQEGDTGELNQMIAGDTSLCAVNKEYSAMIIKRLFEVKYKDGERWILNSESKENENNITPDNSQLGISILQVTPATSSISNYCIPNNLRKARIRLLENNVLEILTNEKTVTTYIAEIERKLKPIYGIATEDEIQDTFNTLSSQQYVIPSLPVVVYEVLESKTWGTLEFEEEEYITMSDVGGHPVRIIVPLTEAENLLNIIDQADRLISENFHEKALKGMYASMLELKNDYWLDEGDEEGSPLSLDEFRERIMIIEISFNSDSTVTLICDADGMFGEQNIVIHTDTRGIYKDSALGS